MVDLYSEGSEAATIDTGCIPSQEYWLLIGETGGMQAIGR